MVHDDIVSVVLQDTLTKGERTLVESDRDNLLLLTRSTFKMSWATT